MISMQKGLQIKRGPLNKWSISEQLCLTWAVVKHGDQDWMAVSRTLKPFAEPNRPIDWLHPNNCAAQYRALLENELERRRSDCKAAVEPPIKGILARLRAERIKELEKCLLERRMEYLQLNKEIELLESGKASEELLDKWDKEIDEEELREQEVEIARKSRGKTGAPSGLAQKRKTPDSLDSLMNLDMNNESQHLYAQEISNTAQAQNVANSFITSQESANSGGNPTTANLLNSSMTDVSPSFQQLVTTAITQEPNTADPNTVDAVATDILEESIDTLLNITINNFENIPSEVEFTSEHLQLDDVITDLNNVLQASEETAENANVQAKLDNVDIIRNLDNDLQELDNDVQAAEEAAAKEKMQAERLAAAAEKVPQKIDPFEFEEDPEICQLQKPSRSHKYQHHAMEKHVDVLEKPIMAHVVPIQRESVNELKVQEKPGTGSVEIVEAVVMDETEVDKQLSKSQIQDIVHSVRDTTKVETEDSIKKYEYSENLEKYRDSIEKPIESPNNDSVFDKPSTSADLEMKSVLDEGNKNMSHDIHDTTRDETSTPEYSSYSRTKKRESKNDFYRLLAVQKMDYSENKLVNDNLSKDDQESEKRLGSLKPKIELNTEEILDKLLAIEMQLSEEMLANGSFNYDLSEDDRESEKELGSLKPKIKPIDSPASSSEYIEDDREYRSWKKSAIHFCNRLATHKFSSLFLKPITNDMAPGYHSIVNRPMDLQTIRKNTENGAIRTTLELQRDVMLMFTNSIMYNKTEEFIYNKAKQMQQESMRLFQKIFLQAQQGNIPPRCETKTNKPIKRKRSPDDNVRNKKRKEY